MPTTRFRFVHAADLHLDTPFQGIARLAPEIGEALRDASLAAWDNLVRLVIERDAAFLLLAGDVYDGAERGVRAQLRFHEGLERLARRGIQTFVVHGNHDPLDGWSAIREWPPGVTIFDSRAVSARGIDREGTRIATVHGISYPRRDVTENLALRFRRGPEPGLHIGLLHCNLGNNSEHGSYCPCSVDDLRRAGMNYWALGHLHRFQIVRPHDPLIAYPGSLQARSTRPGEAGVKGALVVEADGTTLREHEFVPLDVVRFLPIRVDASEAADLPELRTALATRAAELRLAQPGRSLLVRANIEGRGEVHRDLQRPGALAGLLDELRHEGRGDHPFLWWEALVDRTAPDLDYEAIRQRADFSAELLAMSEGLGRDARSLQRFLHEGEGALRRIAIPEWVVESGPEAERDLLDDATRLALELLAEE